MSRSSLSLYFVRHHHIWDPADIEKTQSVSSLTPVTATQAMASQSWSISEVQPPLWTQTPIGNWGPHIWIHFVGLCHPWLSKWSQHNLVLKWCIMGGRCWSMSLFKILKNQIWGLTVSGQGMKHSLLKFLDGLQEFKSYGCDLVWNLILVQCFKGILHLQQCFLGYHWS